jgi:hypothetical protein
MKKLDDACAAFSSTLARGRMLTITLTRVVFDEEHLRVLNDPKLAALLVDPEMIGKIKVGSVRWMALLRLPQKGSTLQIERAGDTIEEAEDLLADAMLEALAEEARTSS